MCVVRASARDGGSTRAEWLTRLILFMVPGLWAVGWKVGCILVCSEKFEA